jgi:hypothetical protein
MLDDISSLYPKTAATTQACGTNPGITPHALLNSDSHVSGASNLPARALIRAQSRMAHACWSI